MTLWRGATLGRCVLALAAALGSARISRGQSANAGAQAANASALQTEYDALVALYSGQISALIAAERQRQLLGTAQDNPDWWNKVAQLGQEFDQQFMPILKAATQVDPAMGLRWFLAWERQTQLAPLETNQAIIAQIEATAPTFTQAYNFLLDTLANHCQTNAAEVVPAIIESERDLQLGGGGGGPAFEQKIADCVRKATLLVDVDAEVDGAKDLNLFPTSKAHARAEGIQLKYDPGTDQFIGTYPLQYVSYEYTTDFLTTCVKATPVSGSITVVAHLMKTMPPEFLVEFLPDIGENTERPGFKDMAGVGHDGMKHETGCPPNLSEKHRSFDFKYGFHETGLAGPHRLQLGGSDVFVGKPFTQTNPITFPTSSLIITFSTP